METINIFIFGQSQEQIENNFNIESAENKELFKEVRRVVEEHSLKEGKELNLFTSLDRGLGFTSFIVGLSLRNEYNSVFKKVKVSVVNPHTAFTMNWDYKAANKYDELGELSDSTKFASHGKEQSEDDWLKVGKYMADNSDLGIIIQPDEEVNNISEVMTYAFNKNVKVIKINEETLESTEVTLLDVMI